MKVEGGGAQRMLSSATLRSGAQFAVMKMAAKTMVAASTPPRIRIAVTIAVRMPAPICSIRAYYQHADVT